MSTRTPTGQQTPSSSLTRSTSTDPIKKRSIREIYETGTPNSLSIFVLFSQIDDPLTFEEAYEEEVWEHDMDQEI